MYIPNHNLVTDKQEKLAFMKQYNFAAIVSAKDNIPTAHIYGIAEHMKKIK